MLQTMTAGISQMEKRGHERGAGEGGACPGSSSRQAGRPAGHQQTRARCQPPGDRAQREWPASQGLPERGGEQACDSCTAAPPPGHLWCPSSSLYLHGWGTQASQQRTKERSGELGAPPTRPCLLTAEQDEAPGQSPQLASGAGPGSKSAAQPRTPLCSNACAVRRPLLPASPSNRGGTQMSPSCGPELQVKTLGEGRRQGLLRAGAASREVDHGAHPLCHSPQTWGRGSKGSDNTPCPHGVRPADVQSLH